MKNIEEFKEKLEAEKKLLMMELSGLGVMNPENNDWEAIPTAPNDENDTSDENDNADRFEEYQEKSATLAILGGRLKDVNHALKKIDDGTYGKCEVSGEPIDEERLRANPAAKTCTKHINQ